MNFIMNSASRENNNTTDSTDYTDFLQTEKIIMSNVCEAKK